MFYLKKPSKINLLKIFTVLIILFTINSEYLKLAYKHQYYVYEQDAYMHLVIAQDFLHNLNLYQHFNSRINTPWGANTHGWSNLVTLLLAGGVFILHFFLSLDLALYVWAFFLPIFAFGISSFVMLWAISALRSSLYQQIFIIAAFLLNPFLQGDFLPLRVDYDFLLIPIYLIYCGLFLRILTFESSKRAMLLAILADFGLWTSISFMLPLVVSLIFLLWQNIHKLIGNRTIYCFLSFLIAGMVPIVFLEHRSFFSATHDVISIVHLILFLITLAAYTVYQLFSPSTWLKKITLILALTYILFYLMESLFPGFYLGPYNEASPLVRSILFPNVSEFHSPFAINNSLALALFCYFFIGGGYFYYLYLNSDLTQPKLFLLFFSVIMTAMTAYMYRWCIFSMPLNIWLVSFIIRDFINNKIIYIKLAFFTIILFLPNLILLLAKNYINPEQQQCEIELHAMLSKHFFEQPQFHHDKSLLIHSNYGPLILYNTHLSIVASNDHHNSQGLKDSYYFFKSNNQQAKKIADARKIDLLLICPKAYSIGFDPNHTTWLKGLQFPDNYNKWQLYRKIN